MKRNISYSLRMPASLMGSLKETAEEDGVSINQFVCLAVAEKLSAMKTASLFKGSPDAEMTQEARNILARAGTEPPRKGDAWP